MSDIRERVADLRTQARALADDDGRRQAVLSLLSDADSMLDSAERKFQRAQKEFRTTYDADGRLRGGWEIVRG